MGSNSPYPARNFDDSRGLRIWRTSNSMPSARSAEDIRRAAAGRYPSKPQYLCCSRVAVSSSVGLDCCVFDRSLTVFERTLLNYDRADGKARLVAAPGLACAGISSFPTSKVNSGHPEVGDTPTFCVGTQLSLSGWLGQSTSRGRQAVHGRECSRFPRNKEGYCLSRLRLIP